MLMYAFKIRYCMIIILYDLNTGNFKILLIQNPVIGNTAFKKDGKKKNKKYKKKCIISIDIRSKIVMIP